MTETPAKIRPAKFAHVVLRTSFERKDELVRWYQNLLHARIVHENPVLAFLTYDDEHHRLAVIGMPGLPERPAGVRGVDHVAYTYASVGDLVHTYERLKAGGIEPAMPIHHGATVSLYYLDPDANQVELQVDVFESAEETDAFLHSEQFQKNPIGVLFDPDELARRHHEGVPETELKRPLEGPPPPLDAFPVH